MVVDVCVAYPPASSADNAASWGDRASDDAKDAFKLGHAHAALYPCPTERTALWVPPELALLHEVTKSAASKR